MKILLTGCSGYVGGIIAPFFSEAAELYQTNTRGSFTNYHRAADLRNIDEVQALAEWIQPDVIIHAAGNKNSKFCEEHEDEAAKINVTACENLIRAFGANVKYIYISSDYVFDGMRGNYTEEDTPAPFTAYGRQKLAAEKIFLTNAPQSFIVRLAALFDNNATFCKFLRDQFEKNVAVECFDDVFYSPTYYRNFLQILNALVFCEDFSRRIFHCGGERVSRFRFASMYAEHSGFPTNLVKECKLFDAAGGNFFFLKPDISLSNAATLKYLNLQPLSLCEALIEL
ncbi:MAG: sugar nucleotide-binding protein [Selenomonadaceae bacterium]|nr:sugar nucleotide-binding protein [Selenomonadaceae bacterium]